MNSLKCLIGEDEKKRDWLTIYYQKIFLISLKSK